MSDLSPIGEVLLRTQAEHATARELRAAHFEVTSKLKRDRDPEGAALQFAWLALVAINRLADFEQRMGESHEHDPAGRPGGGDRPEPDLVHVLGGGWRAAAGAPAQTKRR